MKITGAKGDMRLLDLHDADTARVRRSLRLEASPDGKSVILVDEDLRKDEQNKEYRFEVTAGDLIALLRSHGKMIPGTA